MPGKGAFVPNDDDRHKLDAFGEAIKIKTIEKAVAEKDARALYFTGFKAFSQAVEIAVPELSGGARARKYAVSFGNRVFQQQKNDVCRARSPALDSACRMYGSHLRQKRKNQLAPVAEEFREWDIEWAEPIGNLAGVPGYTQDGGAREINLDVDRVFFSDRPGDPACIAEDLLKVCTNPTVCRVPSTWTAISPTAQTIGINRMAPSGFGNALAFAVQPNLFARERAEEMALWALTTHRQFRRRSDRHCHLGAYRQFGVYTVRRS